MADKMIDGTWFSQTFNEESSLKKLGKFLPDQAPLKDFIHHNTLHAFQNKSFHEALVQASLVFGYKGYLSVGDFRRFVDEGKINPIILEDVIRKLKGEDHIAFWKSKLMHDQFSSKEERLIGSLRSKWIEAYTIDLDGRVFPKLFRHIGNYLDQGISIWNFPAINGGFVASLRELDASSYVKLFTSKRVRKLFYDEQCTITTLLGILVGDEALYEHYLFDQQFAHPGWSGMVAFLEKNPQTIVAKRNVSLKEFILLELLLELDYLDDALGTKWKPICTFVKPGEEKFTIDNRKELFELLEIFQEAYEWSYYDEVLKSIQLTKPPVLSKVISFKFQAIFCIDDRECSLRRNIENIEPACETFGTPGHFNLDYYFLPKDGKYYSKLCPAPIKPNHLIKEVSDKRVSYKDIHFSKTTHGLFRSWITIQTIGIESAFKLLLNVFWPSVSPATISSLKHKDANSTLTYEYNPSYDKVDGLQIGFTTDEMVTRVEGQLRGIGLVENFAPLIYVIGHGSSTVNNPHYSAYDCGACSGRPGSVNARVFCTLANRKDVRMKLKEKGIAIPDSTYFIGGIHDTTRDDIDFFDISQLPDELQKKHEDNLPTFKKALDNNAKERSRRFESIDTKLNPEEIHQKIQVRSVSLFEPRPELNHATNALCIVGLRSLTKNLFMDRRAFMNSYNYKLDSDGKLLEPILNAIAPVCGGINLEYYFSRVDNEKLGTGTKLPHNVMGLIGVTNGTEGDLRTGLPSQMIEVHDPMRLLVIVEQHPEVVFNVIKRNENTFGWFKNEWIHLVVINPENHQLYQLVGEEFVPYIPKVAKIPIITNLFAEIEKSKSDACMPVSFIVEK